MTTPITRTVTSNDLSEPTETEQPSEQQNVQTDTEQTNEPTDIEQPSGIVAQLIEQPYTFNRGSLTFYTGYTQILD